MIIQIIPGKSFNILTRSAEVKKLMKVFGDLPSAALADRTGDTYTLTRRSNNVKIQHLSIATGSRSL